MKQRLRRQTQRTRLPVESLEQRVVPAATGSVSGFAFIDANGDGLKNFLNLDNDVPVTQDVGEPDELVVKGATLHLTGTSDAGATVNAQTTTNQQGAFSFTVVPAGTYRLKADSNAAISGTLGNGVTVTVGTTSVPKDVPINCVVVTGEFLLNPISSITELDQEILADFPLPTAGTGMSTGINEAPTLRTTVANPTGQPADVNVALGVSSTTVDLAGVFDDPNITTSQVQFHTTDGDVTLDLFDDLAPMTVQNFYNYVGADAYDGTIFHRRFNPAGPDPVNILQGGGFEYTPKTGSVNPTITAITDEMSVQVKNEFSDSRSNVAGTIAMAKNSNPDSATSQFFFNLADNSVQLDSASNAGGFTVFGRVVGQDGDNAITDPVVTSLAATLPQSPTIAITTITDPNVRSALSAIPLRGTLGTDFPTNTTAANFLRITGIDTIVRDEVLTYSVVPGSIMNETLLTGATIVNNRLTLTYAPTVRGDAAIVVRATDKQGLTTDATILVHVGVPSVTTLALTPSIPQPTSTITATATVADPNGLTPKLDYVWRVNDAVVKTTSATTSTSDTLVLGTETIVAVGDTVSVDVTPSDTIATGSTVTSSKIIVANSAPSATVSLSGVNEQLLAANEILTATVLASDPNSDPISLTYVWKVKNLTTMDETTLPAITTSDTTSTFTNGTDAVLDLGTSYLISVEVTPNDGQLDGLMTLADRTVVGA